MAKASTFAVLAFGRICTSGQSVQKSVGTPLVVLLGLFQSTDVKDLIELSHHTPDVQGRKPAVLHGIDDIATASVVAPRLGQHSSQHRIIVHSVIPHKGGRRPAAPAPPLRRELPLTYHQKKRGKWRW